MKSSIFRPKSMYIQGINSDDQWLFAKNPKNWGIASIRNFVMIIVRFLFQKGATN